MVTEAALVVAFGVVTPVSPPDVCSVDLAAPVMIWNQLLSAAGCAADDSILAIEDPGDVELVLDELHDGIEPSMTVYKLAVMGGPDDIALHAAFQIGNAEVALITRARASVTPGPAAVDIRRRLEIKLVPDIELARLAFRAVLGAVSSRPELAVDPVAVAETRLARQSLAALGDVEGDTTPYILTFDSRR